MSTIRINQRFIRAEDLLDRWQISDLDLKAILTTYRIRVLDANSLETIHYDDNMLKADYIDKIAFDLVDIENFEREYPEHKPEEDPEPLNGKERQELGRLKEEEEKWDLSLKAAVHIGIYCANKEPGSILKRMVQDEFTGEFVPLPVNTIEKIWKAILT